MSKTKVATQPKTQVQEVNPNDLLIVKNKPTDRKRGKMSVKEPLKGLPTNYDFVSYAPLKKTDFEEEYLWYLHMGEFHELQADQFRAEAEELKKLGGAKERRAVKQLQQYQAKIKELTSVLKASGVDVSAILAQLTPKK
jgi:hypothetical protein